MWRRIYLIDFEVVIPPEKINENIRNRKFKNECSGILNWLIEGCLEWQKIGLKQPKKVIDSTSEYKTDSDILGEFIDAISVRLIDDNVMHNDLYEKYEIYCKENSDIPLPSRTFTRRMKEKDFIHRRGGAGGSKKYWLNIKLKE